MAKKVKKVRKPQIVLWRLRHDLRTNVIATQCSAHVDGLCWLYQGGVPLGSGYLAVNWPGKNGLEHAHVAAYKLFKGKIPRGKRVVDKCGEEIIPGKLGHVFDCGDGQFGIVLEDTPSGPSRARLLLSRKKAALEAGFLPKQQGECESVLVFDPQDRKQAKLAAKLVKAKKKRNVRANPASLANIVRPSTQMAPQPPGTNKSEGVDPGGLATRQAPGIPDEGYGVEGFPKSVAA